MDPTYVVTDAGSCHEGELKAACALIETAKKVGANAVKFQWVSDPSALARRRHVSGSAYALLAMSRVWLAEVVHHAKVVGIDFLCTVYLPDDIPVIARYVPRFKIASFEATDHQFVLAHRSYRKPLLISTGMMTADEVVALDHVVTAARMDAIFLHCVSAYPTPIEAANLGCIGPALEGFSDHTQHPLTGAFAVMAGARVVEFHLRLEDTRPSNPDYVVARNPREASEYIFHIRLAEIMRGDGGKRVMEAERPWMRYQVR